VVAVFGNGGVVVALGALMVGCASAGDTGDAASRAEDVAVQAPGWSWASRRWR
jgi:hypothetical protein